MSHPTHLRPEDDMSEPRRPPRVYGEQEIGLILQRATEIQHQQPSTTASGGLTLAELEEIAAEAGIDPAHLRRAALEMDSGIAQRSIGSRLAGADVVLVRETELDGELAEDGFENIVGTVQATSRVHGQPSLLGRTLTWRAETANKSRTVQLVVTSRDGRTLVRLEENLGQLAAGLFGGAVGGGGLGLGLGLALPIGIEVLGSALFTAVAPVGVVGLAYLASRAIYRRIVRHRRRVFDDLFDRIVAEARASIAGSPESDAGPSLPRPAR